MARSVIPWQRFWVPRDGAIRYAADGFLENPQSDWGEVFNPDVQQVNLLAEIPCLVLLGEAGSGKSRTLEQAHIEIEDQLAPLDHRPFWVDLHEVGSEYQLARRLFDEPSFIEWKAGNSGLTLFLDSLDECRLHISTLPGMLIHEFQGCPIDRLNLRIACRTAEWPATLSQVLEVL